MLQAQSQSHGLFGRIIDLPEASTYSMLFYDLHLTLFPLEQRCHVGAH